MNESLYSPCPFRSRLLRFLLPCGSLLLLGLLSLLRSRSPRSLVAFAHGLPPERGVHLDDLPQHGVVLHDRVEGLPVLRPEVLDVEVLPLGKRLALLRSELVAVHRRGYLLEIGLHLGARREEKFLRAADDLPVPVPHEPVERHEASCLRFASVGVLTRDGDRAAAVGERVPGLLADSLPLVVLDGVLVRVHEPLRDLVAAEGVAVDAEVGVRVDREVLHFDPVVPEVGLQRHRSDDR